MEGYSPARVRATYILAFILLGQYSNLSIGLKEWRPLVCSVIRIYVPWLWDCLFKSETTGHLFISWVLWLLHLVQYILASSTSSTKLKSNTVLTLPLNHGKCLSISLAVPRNLEPIGRPIKKEKGNSAPTACSMAEEVYHLHVTFEGREIEPRMLGDSAVLNMPLHACSFNYSQLHSHTPGLLYQSKHVSW